MRIRNNSDFTEVRTGHSFVRLMLSHKGLFLCLLVALGMTSCKQDIASEASDSDANGYICLKCGVKLYTERSRFIGPRCPKCSEDSLMDVVAYTCAKDHQLIVRPRRGDRGGAPVCDKCQANLANSMFLPREKDLKAWGATKASG